MRQDYYVYLHRRLSDGRIFYVGKGTGRRAYSSCSRSKEWHANAQQGYVAEIATNKMSESAAYGFEVELIDYHRSIGSPLVNKSKGGGGARSYVANKRIPVYCSNGMRFESHADATEWLRANGHPLAVASSLSLASLMNQRAYGYRWDRNAVPEQLLLMCSNGMTFITTGKAAKWLQSQGHDARRGAIGRAANGLLKSAYGLRWGWGEIKDDVPRRQKRVYRSDGVEYKSIRQAERETGWCRLAIARACRTGLPEHGYNWRNE